MVGGSGLLSHLSKMERYENSFEIDLIDLFKITHHERKLCFFAYLCSTPMSTIFKYKTNKMVVITERMMG